MAALIAPLTLTSCSDDFLDVTPPDKATLQEYYSNKEHPFVKRGGCYLVKIIDT